MTRQDTLDAARPGYEPLAEVLARALDQSQSGKGHERHGAPQGIEKPFLEQPICDIGRMVGPGFCLGQAMKKAHEAAELPRDRAVAELLGAIVYLAAAVILIEEREGGVAQATPAAKPKPRAKIQPLTPEQQRVADAGIGSPYETRDELAERIRRGR